MSGCFAKRAPLSAAPESPQRYPRGAEGEGLKGGTGVCDLDRARKDVALNGGDRLPAGIQTPPQRPPEGVFPGEEKDNKELCSAQAVFGWYVGRGGWEVLEGGCWIHWSCPGFIIGVC